MVDEARTDITVPRSDAWMSPDGFLNIRHRVRHHINGEVGGAGRQTGPRNEVESVDSALAAYRLGQAEAARSRSSESRSSGVRDVIVALLVVGAVLGGLWAVGNWPTVVNLAADSFQSPSAPKPDRVVYEAADRTTCDEIAAIGGTCRSPMPRR